MVAPFIFQEANCLENTETKPVFAKNVPPCHFSLLDALPTKDRKQRFS